MSQNVNNLILVPYYRSDMLSCVSQSKAVLRASVTLKRALPEMVKASFTALRLGSVLEELKYKWFNNAK